MTNVHVMEMQPYLALSQTVAGLPCLDALLGAPVLLCSNLRRAPSQRGTVLAWGRKPSAGRAEAYAARYDLPVLHLEDGFARSVSVGSVDPPLSLIRDDLGVYYDATAPSRLERLVGAPFDPKDRPRVRTLIALWREGRISKYNHARDDDLDIPEPFVLVADQTRGDASIGYGLAGQETFSRMLEAALDEHPEATIVLKIHPEVASGRKQGHFDLDRLRRLDRLHILDQDIHPVGLLARATAVYTVTSQLGFEALLWDRPCRVFGMPFYAGWGLTRDELPAPSRRRPASLDALVLASLVDYPRYRDPETGQACSPERVLRWLGLQRHLRQRFPARIHALGFSAWKRPIVRSFFQGSQVRFVRRPSQVPPRATLAVWGRRDTAKLSPNVRCIRLEDGFLRSVGLGGDLIRPLSWVMDPCGIYYDATRPSRLERLLDETDFSPELLQRAQNLRQRIVATGITKYNVGNESWQRPATASRVVLVPGQVETDASITWGAHHIRTNMQLLRTVRKREPQAYLVYKPHPDVVSKLRQPGQEEQDAARFCDAIVLHAPMHQLLGQVDAVHVLTSLTGFEALLREKDVFCYGWPFYAGWGLTRDVLAPPRRTRRLTLDALVAGALILYPSYISPTSGRFTTPEKALDELVAWRLATRLPSGLRSGATLSWWRRLRRTLLGLLRRP